MTRQQLLEILTSLLVQETSTTPTEARSVLESYTTDELHQQFYKAVNAGKLKPDGTVVRANTPAPPVTQADIERAKAEHQAELARIRADAQRERLNLEIDRSLEFERFVAEREKAEAPKRAAELAHDKSVFEDAYQTLRSFGHTQANLSLLREVLGRGQLSVVGIRAAIQGNAVQLSAPTHQEKEAWAQGDVEQHNQALLNASPSELRAAVRSESEQRRIQAQQEAAVEADKARAARDLARGYPKLPTEKFGKVLDSAYIKRCGVPELKDLIRKYGETQITNRLRGIE